LGMMLVLYGAIRRWTGGAPTGALTDGFRQWGRGGVPDTPGQFQVPYALVVVVVLGLLAALLMRRPFGRTLVATCDNNVAAGYAGSAVRRARTRAFLLSGLLLAVDAVLLGGHARAPAHVRQG